MFRLWIGIGFDDDIPHLIGLHHHFEPGESVLFCVVHRRVSGTQRILSEIAPMGSIVALHFEDKDQIVDVFFNGSFTLTETDSRRDSDSDSKLDDYIVLCRTFHIAQTCTQIPTPYFCVGQASESESVSGNVNEPLLEALHTGTDLGFSVGTRGDWTPVL